MGSTALAVSEVLPLVMGALALVAVNFACSALVWPLQVVPQGNWSETVTVPDLPAVKGLIMVTTRVSFGAVP